MEPDYFVLKALHILGAVIFLGNILVTGWWKGQADRTRNPEVLAFAQHQVTLTDFLFTASGVALVLVTGLWMARQAGLGIGEVAWVTRGFWLLTASGGIWAAVLIPVQVKQARMARQFRPGQAIPAAYWRLEWAWMVFGTLATLLPLASLYWMVFKPA